jgi:pimeloyl-ACP methyl ester carboxylesterase
MFPAGIRAGTILCSKCRHSKRVLSTAAEVTEVQVRTADGHWLLPTRIHHCKDEQGTSSPPLLLIQGWVGVSEDWGAVPKLLASRIKRDVIVYDPRMLGQAQKLSVQQRTQETRLSLEQLASDAITILNHLSQTIYNDRSSFSFGIGGASKGGMVAQLVVGSSLGLVDLEHEQNSQQRPWSVSSMLLMCTTAGGTPPKYPINKKFLDSFRDWHHDPVRSASQFFSALGDEFLARPGRMRLQEKLIHGFIPSRRQFATEAHLGISAQRDSLLEEDFDSTPFLEQIGERVPSLIVHGKDDNVVDYRNALLLQGHLGSSCRVDILDPCDHLLWITHGKELVDKIAMFYESCVDSDCNVGTDIG